MKKTPPDIYPRNKCTKFQPIPTIFGPSTPPQSFWGHTDRQTLSDSSSTEVENCKKLLHNYDLLCDILNRHTELKEKFSLVFETVAKPQNLIFAKRFLTPDEIETVTKFAERFCAVYPVHFDKNIKPKMHFLSFDIPRFLKTHKTIGLLSEEEGESLHAAINMENRVLACMKQDSKRLLLSLRRHAIRSECDKTLLARKSRICKSCKSQNERSYFKNGLCGKCGTKQG